MEKTTNIKRNNTVFKLLMAVFLAIFTMSCHQGTGSRDAVDWADSAQARFLMVQDMFNNEQHDSLLIVGPDVLDFLREKKEWELYYSTWQIIAEDHVWYNEYSEATREIQAMLEDALARRDTFGLALSYLTQGTAYMMQNDLYEATLCFKTAIDGYPNGSGRGQLIDAYGSYAECMVEAGDYAGLDSLLVIWRTLLDHHAVMDDTDNAETYANYWYLYYEQKFHYLLHQDSLNLAAEAIDSVEHYVRLAGNHNVHRIHIANLCYQLRMAQGDYAAALDYAEELMRISGGDMASRQRALEIRSNALEKLGRYREALADQREYNLLNDSVTQPTNRDQLNRLNKRFELNELKARNELLLQRSRFTTGSVAMIMGIVALLAFLSFNSRWTRRMEIKNLQLRRERNLVLTQNKQLAVERDRAEAASKAKTAFLQSMTHEIRTPLNAISGFTQVLNMKGIEFSEEERIDFSRHIQDNTRLLTNIVDDLILLADFESNSELPAPEECTTFDLIGPAVETTRPQVADTVTLSYKCEIPEDQLVRTYPKHIHAILSQLLGNAAKFTREGSIVLTLCQEGELFHFSVIDTGPGIPADQKDNIFERFVKLDSFVQGTGLGLTVARMTAEHLGGTLTLDTDHVGGAKFDLLLPVEKLDS